VITRCRAQAGCARFDDSRRGSGLKRNQGGYAVQIAVEGKPAGKAALGKN
jgi:hypothetical protein